MTYLTSDLFRSIPYIHDLLRSVNWTNKGTQYSFLTLILIFFIISPSIQRVKGSEIEVEMRLPSPLELSSGMIEKNLTDLESHYKSKKSKSAYGAYNTTLLK
jgi:hypothetical protein